MRSIVPISAKPPTTEPQDQPAVQPRTAQDSGDAPDQEQQRYQDDQWQHPPRIRHIGPARTGPDDPAHHGCQPPPDREPGDAPANLEPTPGRSARKAALPMAPGAFVEPAIGLEIAEDADILPGFHGHGAVTARVPARPAPKR